MRFPRTLKTSKQLFLTMALALFAATTIWLQCALFGIRYPNLRIEGQPLAFLQDLLQAGKQMQRMGKESAPMMFFGKVLPAGVNAESGGRGSCAD